MKTARRFDGKVAVVTGASQGLGEAIARGLGAEGARVAMLARREDVLAQVAGNINEEGGEATFFKVDATVSEQVNNAVNKVLDRFGRIDILVNNAGGDREMPFVKTTEDLWDYLIALNLKSQLICCQAVLGSMIQSKYGKIVNIASDYGRAGTRLGSVVYSGCKGGVVAFTKSLAMEMARYNINVNSVSPGFIETPAATGWAANRPEGLELATRSIPMRRAGRPDELAEAVLFLASDQASYITGQTLSVNGGLFMID